MKEKMSSQEKLVKLFENVSRVDMNNFKKYLDTKTVLNENPQVQPQREPEVAPNQPTTLPSPEVKPTTKPEKRPNPFAPSIEPDAEPKGVAEQEGQQKPIDILAKKLSDEIAATYNQKKSPVTNQQPK